MPKNRLTRRTFLVQSRKGFFKQQITTVEEMLDNIFKNTTIEALDEEIRREELNEYFEKDHSFIEKKYSKEFIDRVTLKRNRIRVQTTDMKNRKFKRSQP